MDEPLFEVNDLKVAYRRPGHAPLMAVKGVTFTLQAGDCMIIAGRSDLFTPRQPSDDFMVDVIYVTQEFIQVCTPQSNYGVRGHLSLFENPTRCADFPMEFMNALYTSLLQDSIDDWAASLQTDLPAMMFVRRVACEVYAIAPPTSIMAAPISTTAVARTNPDFSLVFPMASPSRCRSAALCRTAGPLSARHGLGRLARQAGAAR